VVLLTGLGYGLGGIPIVRRNFDKAILLIVLLSLLPSAIEFWRSRRASAGSAGSSH
jgi:membrane-associated protein